jgi:hypothetical protein
VSGELEAATDVLAIEERSTVSYYITRTSTYRSGRGWGLERTWGVGIAEHPLPELFRVEDILDADVARGPVAGLLVSLRRSGDRSGSGERHWHTSELVLALCLGPVGRVLVVVQRLGEDRSPRMRPGPVLLDRLVHA